MQRSDLVFVLLRQIVINIEGFNLATNGGDERENLLSMIEFTVVSIVDLYIHRWLEIDL